MASIGKIARRSFLVGVAAIAGGVAVGYYFYRKPFANPLVDGLAEGEATFNPYVKIAADNTITIIVPRAEMGQGVTTTLAAMVAEELAVDLDQITVEHGPVGAAYYNPGLMVDNAPFAFFDEATTAEAARSGLEVVAKLVAIQATGGSSSTRHGFDKMRQAGAAARMLLTSAAAQKLGVAESELEALNGAILHKASGKSLTGGFGRRLELDYALYATVLAAAVDGRPVKVTWTREEDTTHDAYRPAAVGKFRAVLGDDGLPVAVEMKMASPSIIAGVMGRMFPSLSPVGPDKYIFDAAYDQPYTVANYEVSGVAVPVAIPAGFWRSVGASINGFFHEAFMDEIAVAGKIDAIEMRKRLMAEHPTAVKVVEKVAEMANWAEALPQGKAKGFAFTLSNGSWVGEVVQIADTPAGLRVEKIWIAADVGTAIDPEIIKAQLTSPAIFGLSAAMGQEITFADGMVEQTNFPDHDSLRISQCPVFEVAILENYHKMGGVGEVGAPPVAPALASAIYALTGNRIRSLPLSKAVSFA